MKIKPINYMHGGYSLEIVAETEVECMILRELWKFGTLETGNGDSVNNNNGAIGFFIKPKQETKSNDTN